MSAYPCPACGNTTTTVVDVKLHRSYAANTMRRRRHCPACREMFDTIEQLFRPGKVRKLTPLQVASIRRRFGKEQRPTYASVAREFSVSVRTIQDIVTGRTWPQPERNVMQRKSTEESSHV